ncbi:MAG: energy transducer TonB [Vicingaceae bacterium]
MEKEEKNKRTGLIASIGIHLALLLVFAFFGMSYMVPPPEEEGITINFGNTDQGRMDPTPVETNTQTEEIISETPTEEPTPEQPIEEDILTQTTEEAPSLDKKKEEKKEVKKEEEEKKKEEPKPDKNLSSAIDKWKKNKNNNSGGDGTTDQSGDQGKSDGDPNSKNYLGGGSGNGVSYNLSGRNMIGSPKIEDDSQEEGTVVVEIIVDRYGKVVRAEPGARGSTTTDPTLYKKAKEAALKTRFNAKPDAAESQKGTMTFIFILN